MIVLSAFDHHDSVGHPFENPLVLQQLADPERLGEMLAIDKNARVGFAGQTRQSPHGATDFLHLDVAAEIGCPIDGGQSPLILGIAKKQDFAL